MHLEVHLEVHFFKWKNEMCYLEVHLEVHFRPILSAKTPPIMPEKVLNSGIFGGLEGVFYPVFAGFGPYFFTDSPET